MKWNENPKTGELQKFKNTDRTGRNIPNSQNKFSSHSYCTYLVESKVIKDRILQLDAPPLIHSDQHKKN